MAKVRGQVNRSPTATTCRLDNPVTSVVMPAMMASVEEVEVVVAHNERATLRVGAVFLEDRR